MPRPSRPRLLLQFLVIFTAMQPHEFRSLLVIWSSAQYKQFSCFSCFFPFALICSIIRENNASATTLSPWNSWTLRTEWAECLIGDFFFDRGKLSFYKTFFLSISCLKFVLCSGAVLFINIDSRCVRLQRRLLIWWLVPIVWMEAIFHAPEI